MFTFLNNLLNNGWSFRNEQMSRILKKYAQNPEWLLGAEVESEIAFKEAELKNVATVKSAAELAEQELLENSSTVAFRLEKLNFHLHGGLKVCSLKKTFLSVIVILCDQNLSLIENFNLLLSFTIY